MSLGGFAHEPYDWRGITEWMLVHGRNNQRHIIIIPPLFEESNFLRGFIVDIARTLAAKGIGSWLPDLPGTGESLRPLKETGWEDMRGAIAAAGDAVTAKVGSLPHIVSFRGGALLGDAVNGRSWWSYAPASGASILRHLRRAQIISDGENDIQTSVSDDYFYAGYEIAPALHDALEGAVELPVNGPRRTPPAPAGTPLWHRAEPARDPGLSAMLADDIASWIAACDAR